MSRPPHLEVPTRTVAAAGKAWHHRPADEILTELASTPEGLASAEATRRLAEHGPNLLAEGRSVGAWRILLRQFEGVLVWILIVAGIVAGLLGEPMDAAAILAIVVLNAIIGFYQEFRAGKSMAALQKMTAPNARVMRDGHPASIPASAIVQGDLLLLEAGDLVAADGRLLEAASLRCVESALTGESDAVTKQPASLDTLELPLGDRSNLVFMGTSVAGGTGQAVVVATAMKTELGRIAGLIEEAGAEEDTPLQYKLASFGRVLVWVTLGLVAVLFGLGWWRGTPPFELFMTSVSLAVAAVPEGLPTVVTVSLALGVSRMARRGALVRRLPAVETLGSTTVICTDKTGTLTVGQMTARTLYVDGRTYEVTGQGYGPDGDVRIAGVPTQDADRAPLLALANMLHGCNDAHLRHEAGGWKVIGDPTEGALLVAGTKAGGDRQRLERECPRHHDLPFDSERKRATVVRRLADGGFRGFTNGAPGPLLALCTHHYTRDGLRELTEPDRHRILGEVETQARNALRVLGSAYRDLGTTLPAPLDPPTLERDLVFVGLTGMYDPPRPEAKEAVARCHTAGIRVVMITGDHPDTAAAIAREIGIAKAGDAAVTGTQLDAMSEDALRRRLPGTTVYARVTAEHKLRIVRGWKSRDAVVAMTGDGVNDAPAIQGADIGIAMGQTGTEVTKQASDMIVTDDDFATIVAAVEEGRGIYDNIRKTLQYLLAGNTGELLLMAMAVLAGFPSPLLPIHLLWINLVTDGLPALCLATDPIDPDVMKRGPRRRSDRLVDSRFLRTMGLTGVLTAGVAFAVYVHRLKTVSVEQARTEAFTVLVFAELLRAFGGRSATKPLWRMRLLSNLNLALVVVLSLGLQVWSHHAAMFGRFLETTPVALADDLVLLGLGAIPLLVLEGAKVLRNRGRVTPHGNRSPADLP